MSFKDWDSELNNRWFLTKKREPRIKKRSHHERLNKILSIQFESRAKNTTFLLSDDETELAFNYPNDFLPFRKRTL